MFLVGLTGGIATVVDADVIAREVVKNGTSVHRKLRETFDASFFDSETGELNREKMAEHIFRDSGTRKLLNSITHPSIRKKIIWEIIKAFFKGHQFLILDIPLLFESGMARFVQKIVVVSCDSEIQANRLMKRDNITRIEATNKINAQMPLKLKKERANFIIDNNGDIEETFEMVDELISRLRQSWLGLFIKLIVGIIFMFIIYCIIEI
ncbi:Dephospho-CoA kinase [Strongyloides ratti]|uniref:Dephospho-CoA kinase n=1 Tax=Strongyloides ratti TaxID=34506 RepID=A0A090LC23_STRRB|nr:Dephospho-CoA kinase [Strongyloides ratti]CEF67312.1 Dephospho-CoA kinase [Strongyloides ratti]